jgi:hypothetical protein
VRRQVEEERMVQALILARSSCKGCRNKPKSCHDLPAELKGEEKKIYRLIVI